MVRPIYMHELADPDFSWLLTTFKENHPNYISVEGAGLPLVLINIEKSDPTDVQDEMGEITDESQGEAVRQK